MARVFTINFVFNEKQYHTLVTVKTTPFYLEYTLANLDAELVQQLPGSKIISPSANQFLFANFTPLHSTTLMNAIIRAVSQHLQLVTDN